MPERKTWRRAYSRIYTDAFLSHKEFLTEEAFKATIIKGFFTGLKTYKPTLIPATTRTA
jgi:hypothetical protein